MIHLVARFLNNIAIVASATAPIFAKRRRVNVCALARRSDDGSGAVPPQPFGPMGLRPNSLSLVVADANTSTLPRFAISARKPHRRWLCYSGNEPLVIGILVFLFLLGNLPVVSGAPLLPLPATQDLFVLDSGSGHVLFIPPDGSVGVAINRSEILALTGGVEVLYENKGIAFDAAGALYFSAFTSSSPGGFFGGDTSILKKTPAGVLSVLTSQADLSAATGNSDADAEGITFGSDGFLYAIDDSSNALLRVDSLTGKVDVFVDSAAFESLAGLTTVAIKGGIAAGPGGILYVQSNGTPTAVLAISSEGTPSLLTSGDPLQALDQFMTRTSNGDILIADESPDVIHRITPLGGVSTFLSQAQLEAANGGGVTPRGGIAFDSAGNFYLAESNADNILRFDVGLNGTVWVSASLVAVVTGVSPNFNGGIAFEPVVITVLLANFANGNNAVFNSRVYLFNPSVKTGRVTVRVFTLPLRGELAQELTVTPLFLGSLGPKSARNIKLAEDILAFVPGIPTPYTTDGGNLTLEFTIGAASVRGAAQVFDNSLTLGFGTYPLQEVPSTPSAGPTVLVANFMNGNTDFFKSRVYLWNPAASAGNVSVRVFTLEPTGLSTLLGMVDLGSLGPESALNIKLAEDILDLLPGIPTPYLANGGNLTLEFTIGAASVRGAAQVFDNSLTLGFGTYPLQEVPSTPSASPTVLVANFMNGNTDLFKSRVYLWNPSNSPGEVRVRVFTLPPNGGLAQELTLTQLFLGSLGPESARNIKLAEDILDFVPGITTPYTADDGNLTLEFTIQAADVRGTAQVFSPTFAFGTYTLQAVPSVPIPGPTRLVASFTNGNDGAFDSRISLFNPSPSAGDITVRVFTLPPSIGTAQELTTTPLELGTLEARSALDIRLAEDILDVVPGITTPYTTDGGNLILELTIKATDVRGTAQVFSSGLSLGTYPLLLSVPFDTKWRNSGTVPKLPYSCQCPLIQSGGANGNTKRFPVYLRFRS